MLDFFTYPHKLTKELMARGYRPETLPSQSRAWIGLIHKFRKAGYSPQRAANVLAEAMLAEPEAIDETRRVGGHYAEAIFY